ncbi:MAG: hypothetical protein ACK53Y_07140, partial [bacterium]
SAEGVGELPGEENGGSIALRRDDGGVLEGVGPFLQQANAVCAGSDVRDHGYQEDPALGVREAV